MNKKKFGIALLVLVVLAGAFFFPGDKDVKPLSDDEIGKDGGLVEEAEEDSEELDEKENLDEVEEEEAVEDLEDISEEELEKQKAKKVEEDRKLKQEIIEKDKKNAEKKDKNLTDPVPEGKPEPVEPEEKKVEKKSENELKASLSVSCKSILNNMDLFNMDKIDVLPKDGIIYATRTVSFNEGDSVFDILLREMKSAKIHMEFNVTPVYNSNYVQGINNLYEFDCGELSGWRYRVNGWYPNYGSSRYEVKNGDKIEWIYTCDLGRDIGVGDE